MHTSPSEPPSPEQPAPTAAREHIRTQGSAAGPNLDLAASVWESMSAFVFGNDPTDRLRESLGLGRGTGRTRALISLAEGPLGLAELARRIGVDPPYATIIVNELQALGLLSRSADSRDRRRKSVELTPHGRAAARKARDIIARPPAALRDMPIDNLATLHELMGHLNPQSDANGPRSAKPPTTR